MLEDLAGSDVLVGVKQSSQAVLGRKVKKAYVAVNADDEVKLPFIDLCQQHDIPIEYIDSKERLGRACGISVGAACAVICH